MLGGRIRPLAPNENNLRTSLHLRTSLLSPSPYFIMSLEFRTQKRFKRAGPPTHRLYECSKGKTEGAQYNSGQRIQHS